MRIPPRSLDTASADTLALLWPSACLVTREEMNLSAEAHSAQPAATHSRRLPRWAGALSFRNIGAIYVWIFLVARLHDLAARPLSHRPTAKSILNQYAITGLAALSIVLPLAAGIFDLSVGATIGFAGVFAGWCLETLGAAARGRRRADPLRRRDDRAAEQPRGREDEHRLLHRHAGDGGDHRRRHARRLRRPDHHRQRLRGLHQDRQHRPLRRPAAGPLHADRDGRAGVRARADRLRPPRIRIRLRARGLAPGRPAGRPHPHDHAGLLGDAGLLRRGRARLADRLGRPDGRARVPDPRLLRRLRRRLPVPPRPLQPLGHRSSPC